MKWMMMMLVVALGTAATARADVVWLCKPGMAANPCAGDQTTTDQATGAVTTPTAAAKPGIDCFYVYPTVSQQTTVNADKTIDPQETAIAQYQAARFSTRCRVFAPMYRQLTLSSIYTGSTEARAEGRKLAYADVREAFEAYLAHDNHGRGIVLIGHSQGTVTLRILMRELVDPVPAVRRRLVSAILPGGNVLVRKGRTSGGDFANIPLCTADAQIGCAIAFSTFEDAPPDNTRFGRSPATDVNSAGLPAGPDYEVACVNPASLGTNARTPLSSLLRSEPFPGVIGGVIDVQYGGPPPTAATPWLVPSERYSAQCTVADQAHVLTVEGIGSARHLNGSPTPDWGLHITDVNLPLGDLVDDVARQSAAYLARPARLRLRCGRVRGADAALVRAVKLRRRGKVARVRLYDGRRVRLRAHRCG